MSSERNSENFNGCGCGCASLPVVLTFGLALSIFGAAIGGGCSARIPLTESNISFAGSVGSKETSRRALPRYLSERVGSNYDFINSSTTLTIGPAEGTGIFIVGEQPGAPVIDFNINFEK